MKAKRLLIWFLVCALCVPLCACKSEPNVETSSSTAIIDEPIQTTYKKKAPDYSAMLKQHLGVEPAPSSFEELKELARSRHDTNKFYEEYDELQCVVLVFRGTRFRVGRYENAQELFEYVFRSSTSLDFVTDDARRLILYEENRNGPEGMSERNVFRVAVDPSGKFIVLADDPDVPDTDLALFFDTSLVSVETFKYHYLLSDIDIDDELIEAYICENNICRYDLTKENHWKKLQETISDGRYYKLGYKISGRLKSRESNENGEEYIKNAELICFEFEFPVPDGDGTIIENMVFDLKHNKVYLNANENYYLEAELCVDLSDEVLKSLKEDLIKNVGPDTGNKYHNLEYSYTVYVADSKGDYVRYSVYAQNTVNALFDTYWRDLYKMCFGKEHKINTKGYDPELNKKRGINR